MSLGYQVSNYLSTSMIASSILMPRTVVQHFSTTGRAVPFLQYRVLFLLSMRFRRFSLRPTHRASLSNDMYGKIAGSPLLTFSDICNICKYVNDCIEKGTCLR
jgi:hypothetical protein